MSFTPDYNNILDAARNIEPKRIPLYEHIIAPEIMEKIIGKQFAELINGNKQDKRQYFKQYCNFFKEMGYDTVSFEQCITKILPNGGALYFHSEPAIKTQEDFEAYPFDQLPDVFEKKFFDDYTILAEELPPGMKAIGGAGNGLFEIAQDLCGYEGLCFMSVDQPVLCQNLFNKITEVMLEIWKRLLNRFADIFCVARFGDDLGYNKQTLLPEEDIVNYLIPNYKKLVYQIHAYQKPFLLHSCGCIFGVMEKLIDEVKINAKHSNEDGIAPFYEWVEKYGDKIGNFGGVDTDVLCQLSSAEIADYVTKVYNKCIGHGGFAIGSGNSIPDYIPIEGYLAMVNTARRLRGE